MKRQAIVIVVISVIISVYISTRLVHTTRRGLSLVVKSSCFDHQVTDFITVNESRVPGVEPRGNGLYAAVMTKSVVGKYVESETRSFHIGVLKVTNFEERLLDLQAFVEKEKDKSNHVKQLLVLFSIGTTHEKTVLEEMRNGIVAGKYEGAAEVLKLYGMKKFLSMAHGCRQPYILIHDLHTATTVVERTGMCGGVLCAKVYKNQSQWMLK